MITSPPYKNMRTWLSTRAAPKKIAAMMLITNPMNVSQFGEILVSASASTIMYSGTLLPRPNAFVQVKDLPSLVVDRDQLQDLQLPIPVRRHYRCRIADFFPHQAAPDGRGGGNQSFRNVRLLAGHQPIGQLFVFLVVEHLDGRSEGDLIFRDIRHVDE